MQKLSFNRYFSLKNVTYSYAYSTTEDGVVMKNITNDKVCDVVLKLLDSNSNTNNSYSSEQSESLNSFATNITVNFVAPILYLKLFQDCESIWMEDLHLHHLLDLICFYYLKLMCLLLKNHNCKAVGGQ